MKLPQFFIAITACFLLGWGVLVLIPLAVVGGEGPYVDEDNALILPPTPSGSAMAGEKVYRDQGCVYCHSQVVTAPEFQPDVAKGWGPRPTVSRDYVMRNEAFPGIRRFGPDLAFAGWEKRGYTRERLYRHLFDPRLDSPRSNAPTFRYLFETRKLQVAKSDAAIDVTGSIYDPNPKQTQEEIDAEAQRKAAAEEKGEPYYEEIPEYEVVPKREAIDLVEYLLSLNPNYALPEAPLPEVPAEAAPAAPAAGDAAPVAAN